MDVIYIKPSIEADAKQALEDYFDQLTTVASVEDLLAHTPFDQAIIILDSEKKEKLFQDVSMIRQDDQYCLSPIFIDSASEEYPFVDGNLSELSKIKDQAKHIFSLCKDLQAQATDGYSRLLQYLYTRPNHSLKIIRNPQHKYFYHYPLLDSFQPSESEHTLWLEDQSHQGILKKQKLIDKLFICPHCSGAHLKFCEYCPNCHSINIQTESFLHCFTCGEMAPQREFMKEDRLVCPKCSAKLRHIGDEYDRPLESGVCLDCDNSYMDSTLEVTCMHCTKQFPTDKLKKRSVCHYKLSNSAREQIPEGTLENVLHVFDSINYIAPEFFYATLDWMIGMQQRYPEHAFSIIGLKLTTTNSDLTQMIQSLAKQIKATLRTTDLLTRLRQNIIWIILPMTDKAGLEVVQERLIPEDVAKGEIDINSIGFTSNKENTKGESSKPLIAKLMDSL